MTANSNVLYIFYMLYFNPVVNILPKTVRVLPPGGGRKGGVAASAVELPEGKQDPEKNHQSTYRSCAYAWDDGEILQGSTVAYGLTMLGLLEG